MLNRLQLLVLMGLLPFVAMPVWAGEQGSGQRRLGSPHVAEETRGQGEVETLHEMSGADLLAQGVTRVTGVEVIQTDKGLELVLKTVAGSDKPAILILKKRGTKVLYLWKRTKFKFHFSLCFFLLKSYATYILTKNKHDLPNPILTIQQN